MQNQELHNQVGGDRVQLRAAMPQRVTEVAYPQPTGGRRPAGRAPAVSEEKPGIKIGDITYTLFRHRWKILVPGVLGLIAAAGYYLVSGPAGFEARAKLLVHYVLDRSAVDQTENRLDTIGRTAEPVMDAEMQILMSSDIARNVVELIGAERILPNYDASSEASNDVVASVEGPPSAQIPGADGELEVSDIGNGAKPLSDLTTPDEKIDISATRKILRMMTVNSQKYSNVIAVTYRDQDPKLAADILREVLRQYQFKHLQVHRPTSAASFIAKEKETALAEWRNAQRDEQRQQKAARIIWPNGTMASIEAELSVVSSALANSETEYAELQARIDSMGGTKASLTAAAEGAREGAVAEPDDSTIREYRMLQTMLAQLNARQAQLLIDMTPQSSLVIANEQKIADTERRRGSLEKKFPGLVAYSGSTLASGESTGSDPANIMASLKTQLAATGARRDSLTQQLVDLNRRANELAEVLTEVAELNVRRKLKEETYQFYEKSYSQIQVDEKRLDPSRMPNISVIEEPVVGGAKTDMLRLQILGGLAGGGWALGIAIAFLLDMVLDRSIKRPREIDGRLGLPLMMSIPRSVGKKAKSKPKLLRSAAEEPNSELMIPTPTAPWEDRHFIRPYAEAIRDRLEYYFELKRMTHNPKLIGVTALDSGAGASTIAAGLATAFSDTGDGKVLLMDLNPERTGVHPFFEGKPVCSITEALESGRDVNARFKAADKDLFLATVSGNLNTERNRNGETGMIDGEGNQVPSRFIPKQIYDLLPQLKISDFDYVIFELPPLGETSPTVAMAGFMDKMLVVAEAEKTNGAELKRQLTDLERNGADVSCLLNKVDDSVPKWLPS